MNGTTPLLSPIVAAEAGAAALGLILLEPLQIIEQSNTAARNVLLSDGGIGLSPIPGKLVYQPVDGAVRLAWNFEIEESTAQHWWSIRVDAQTGELLSKHDLADNDNFSVPSTTLDSGDSTSSAATAVADGSGYRVFAIPLESPNHGPRSLVTNPADDTASPFGWHDTNGAAGAEFTITRGNNAHAYADTVGDGVPDPLSEPEGGPGLQFDFEFDPSDQPIDYRLFAVTNLFYWNNILHDVFYSYGFTEAAGNFQVNNYGRGGAGNDDVRAEAQDGTPLLVAAPLNNANFSTPADGSRPRMQMYLWQPAYPNAVTVNPPSAISGNYDATDAQFGAPVPPSGITANVALVNDGAGNTIDACEPLIGFPPASIALLERGTCSFTTKVLNAQNAGAIAVIVFNNVPGGPALRMGFATTPTPDTNVARIIIPSVMVSNSDGQRFRANLPFSTTVRRKTEVEPLRDGDLDSGIIAHEYGHGISNRLTGGRLNVNCLSNQEQMGEGWSDFIGLVLTARMGDTATQNRGIGTYALYQPTDGFGIRPTPYTTDMSVNPATYDAIKTAAVPHGVGYVWASMLWEVYWNLVNRYGFNPDVYGNWATAGNNLAIQLVVDGMKLQKCSPGFVDGRNAILLADQVLTAGANQCSIWSGFAKRGLGKSAIQGSSASVADGTQAFDVPPECLVGIAVNPPSMIASQIANSITSQTLGIQNGSAGGGPNLTWSITDAVDDCSSPSDLSWVSVSESSGTTSPGSQSNVNVTFSSNGLSAPATRTGKLCVSSNDPSNPLVEVPLTLNVIYNFQGFFGSVKNPPKLNRVKAGSTVPVVFSLSGNQGTDIFASGFPSSHQMDCDTQAPLDSPEPTLPAGNGLSYDPTTDRYTYRWKTQGDWLSGSCRELTVKLNDGTTHRAFFRFD
ncbi:M36 family metallopeptidase [bacterium]|nr:M36 family metallopeptidase [bacterium]